MPVYKKGKSFKYSPSSEKNDAQKKSAPELKKKKIRGIEVQKYYQQLRRSAKDYKIMIAQDIAEDISKFQERKIKEDVSQTKAL